ncbi:MAG: phosphoglycerate kinase [Alphaproteobacteria bacterium]|nr:phosphoglycerate kinase [Alphaproteobacteria bacterium]
MPAYRTLDDLKVDGRRVLVRGDLNVPMAQGQVSDATRLERLAPTLRELADKGARVIVLSHFGRPKGERHPDMSLKSAAVALGQVMDRDVTFADDCIGPTAEGVVNSLASGDIAVLENLRFHAGEEANAPDFAHDLSDLGDLYVNDAFSVAHRAHASTEQLAHLLPNAAGRQMQAELDALSAALDSPARPVAALVGGAKVSSKLDVLGHLVDKVDMIIIGGGMANTFLHAQGVEVGASLHEPDLAETASAILAKAESASCEIVLPIDAVVASGLDDGANAQTCVIDAVPHKKMILDIGPASIAALESRLKKCKTIVWNGPLGAFEIKPFDVGTNRVAAAAADLTVAGRLVSVAGGGDTVAALNGADATERFTYVSTAGGAFLEWLEGKTLPGVKVLC